MIKILVMLGILIVFVWSTERVGEDGTDNHNGSCGGSNFYIRNSDSSRKS